MSQISTLVENGKKSQAGLVGRGFQAVLAEWGEIYFIRVVVCFY
jgi:hypothetical protein